MHEGRKDHDYVVEVFCSDHCISTNLQHSVSIQWQELLPVSYTSSTIIDLIYTVLFTVEVQMIKTLTAAMLAQREF